MMRGFERGCLVSSVSGGAVWGLVGFLIFRCALVVKLVLACWTETQRRAAVVRCEAELDVM